MVITFQDLTQVRSLEETSRRQDRLAAIGRMAASIAHEIRNPLAAMRGSIQMLHAEMESDSSQAQLMEIILRESDRLNRIITDFLSYARPRSLIQARVDVGDLLHQTFALMRHSPEINSNQSIVEELPDEPLFAEADRRTVETGVLESGAECSSGDAAGWNPARDPGKEFQQSASYLICRHRPGHVARSS